MIVDVYETALKRALADSALFHHLTRVTGKAEIVMQCENLDGIRDKEKNKDKGQDGDSGSSRIPDGPKRSNVVPDPSKQNNLPDFSDPNNQPDKDKRNNANAKKKPDKQPPSSFNTIEYKITSLDPPNDSMLMNTFPFSTERDMYYLWSLELYQNNDMFQKYMNSIQQMFSWAKVMSIQDFMKLTPSNKSITLQSKTKEIEIHEESTDSRHKIKTQAVNLAINIVHGFVLYVGEALVYDTSEFTGDSLFVTKKLQHFVGTNSLVPKMKINIRNIKKDFANHCVNVLTNTPQKPWFSSYVYAENMLSYLQKFQHLKKKIYLNDISSDSAILLEAIEKSPVDFSLYQHFARTNNESNSTCGGVITGDANDKVIMYDFPFFFQKTNNAVYGNYISNKLYYVVKDKTNASNDTFKMLEPLNTNFLDSSWDIFKMIRYNRRVATWTPFDCLFNVDTVHDKWTVRTNSYMSNKYFMNYIITMCEVPDLNLASMKISNLFDYVKDSIQNTTTISEICKTILTETKVDINLRRCKHVDLNMNNIESALSHGRFHIGYFEVMKKHSLLDNFNRNIHFHCYQYNKSDHLKELVQWKIITFGANIPSLKDTHIYLLFDGNFLVSIMT